VDELFVRRFAFALPHRGTLFEPAGYARAIPELAHGLGMVTGLGLVTDVALG